MHLKSPETLFERTQVGASRDFRVGCGGWWDYPGGLKNYARRFDFVEVNTTHYRQVPLSVALRWKSQVPAHPAFEFSVKAPPDFRTGLERNVFLELVHVLDARFVVVRSDTVQIEELCDLLLDRAVTPVIYRARKAVEVPRISRALYAWDPVLEEPTQGAEYARVFGVSDGILDHLGKGMLETARERLRRLAGSLMTIRVVAHTYRSADDALKIKEVLSLL